MIHVKEKLKNSPFTFGIVQNTVVFLEWCEKENITHGELKQLIDEYNNKKELGLGILVTSCPNCTTDLKKMHLPDDTYKLKFLYYCEQCDYERLA